MTFKVKLVLILLIILGYLQYQFWLGKNNYFDYVDNTHALIELKQENELLQARNEQMYEEIKSFRHGREAIEERAINSLGMIYPDEVFFRIVEKKKDRE